MILITGGLGYLGGRIAENLLSQGRRVRLSSSNREAELPTGLNQAELVYMDVRDTDSIDNACSGVKTIIHLAALNAQQSSDSPELAGIINVEGTRALMTSAHSSDVEGILYFSTIHVYGAPLVGRYDELSALKATHPYAVTHGEAESLVLSDEFDSPKKRLVFRLSNAVGRPLHREANCWSLVVNDLCRQAVINKQVVVNSPPGVRRDYIAMSDVCAAVDFFLDESVQISGNTFNLSSGESVTLEEIATLIRNRAQEVLNINVELNFQNDSTINDQLEISADRLAQAGFSATTGLEQEIDGLLSACHDWFMQGLQ